MKLRVILEKNGAFAYRQEGKNKLYIFCLLDKNLCELFAEVWWNIDELLRVQVSYVVIHHVAESVQGVRDGIWILTLGIRK